MCQLLQELKTKIDTVESWLAAKAEADCACNGCALTTASAR